MVIKSPAKLNLDLYVLDKRDDYHEIDSIMVKISLFDIIQIRLVYCQKTRIYLTCKGVKKEENLVYKIARDFLIKMNENMIVDIRIKKNIPICSGLGGASSNAAAVLTYINSYLKKPLSLKELSEFAFPYGSDIVFFLHPFNSARVRGIGDEISEFKIRKMNVDLQRLEEEKKSTKIAYEKLDSKDRAIKIRESLENYEKDVKYWPLYNDFKILYDIKDGYNLTGSGPTIFKLFEKKMEFFEENTNNSIYFL